MRLLHVVDYRGGDETFRAGKPLPQAAELSESLVKLRSVSSILGAAEAPKERESVTLADLRQKILALEINIVEEDAGRKKIEGLLADLERRADEVRPFADLGLPLDLYRGYDSLAVLAGRVSRPVDDIEREVPLSEVFQAPGVAAVFVPKEGAERASTLLGRSGFVQLEPPREGGDPKALLDATVKDVEKWRARLEEARGRIEKLRERYAGFVVAAQEALEVEVEKAEAPLRFAVSDHSFVIDGWVPAPRSQELATRLGPEGVYVELSKSSAGHGAQESPPTLLKNPKPARPFEFLVHLYSTPSYHELDPSVFLLVAFPFLFGFMVGDVGYGILFLIVGAIAVRKLPRTSDLRNLLVVIAMGGFWALILGLFVFGDMFGMPFHSSEELSWEALGLNIPLQSLLNKSADLADMMYLSILFAALHLGASFLIGFVNEFPHSKRHAVAKLGFLLCVLGIFTLITNALAWSRVAGWVWHNVLGWFPRAAIDTSGLVGFNIPFASVGLILTVFLGLGESIIAPLEVGGLLANMMSYARLAGIGVGKAAIATAFNSLILYNLVLNQGILSAIGGIALLAVAQMLVFVLGGISAGIQGIRLNYVESFIKFFKGNGTRFRPFGIRKAQEV